MYPDRQKVPSKELSLLPAVLPLAAAFLISSALLIWNRDEGLKSLWLVLWIIIGIVIAGLLVIRPTYVLLGLIAFAPFYPLIRRLIENNTNSLGMILGSWQDVFLGLLVVSGIIRLLKNKRAATLSGGLRLGDLFFAALGIWALVGVAGQADLFTAFYGFRYTYAFVALYFAVLLLPFNEKHILMLRRVLQATILISALFGIALVACDLVMGTRFAYDYQLYMAGKVDLMLGGGGRLVRFGSTFVLSHGAAPAYILLMLLGLSSYFIENQRKGWIVFLIGLVATATTMSRAAMGAMFLSDFVFLLFLVPKRILFSRSFVMVAAILTLFVAGMLYSFNTLTREYFLTINSGDTVRQNQLLMAVTSSKDYPLGHGTGTTGSSVAIASRYLEGSFSGDTNISDSFHLKVLYELGYPGFVFWMLGFLFTIGSLWKLLANERDEQARSLLAVSISYMIAIGTYSFTSNQLEIWPTKIYFWLIPALAIVFSRIRHNSRQMAARSNSRGLEANSPDSRSAHLGNSLGH